jgi:hypothetical protein
MMMATKVRSNGRRQAGAATSWWMELGAQDRGGEGPGGQRGTGRRAASN